MQEKASLEKLGEAAPAALLVMLVGLAAVLLLARTNLGRGSAGGGPFDPVTTRRYSLWP